LVLVIVIELQRNEPQRDVHKSRLEGHDIASFHYEPTYPISRKLMYGLVFVPRFANVHISS